MMVSNGSGEEWEVWVNLAAHTPTGPQFYAHLADSWVNALIALATVNEWETPELDDLKEMAEAGGLRPGEFYGMEVKEALWN
jgi:hypothetical protein